MNVNFIYLKCKKLYIQGGVGMEINDKVLIRSSIDLDDEQYGTIMDFHGNLVQVHFDLSE